MPVFTCPRCRIESYNPEDIRQQYCGRCNMFFTADGTGYAAETLLENVPAHSIEAIVGHQRHATYHYARLVDDSQMGNRAHLMILHSQHCKDRNPDLRACAFSLALIRHHAIWPTFSPEYAVQVVMKDGFLVGELGTPVDETIEATLEFLDS